MVSLRTAGPAAHAWPRRPPAEGHDRRQGDVVQPRQALSVTHVALSRENVWRWSARVTAVCRPRRVLFLSLRFSSSFFPSAP